MHSGMLISTCIRGADDRAVRRAGFMAQVASNYMPDDGPFDLRMQSVRNGGSLIIANRTGHLPGIRGRLNPILDNLDRTYLYADNVAIEDGLQQPVHFSLNEPIRLTDSMGASATLWFREMVGSSCVFDYRYKGPSMSNWRDSILREFNAKVARLIVVADPDGLLPEEDILADIRQRGFELIPFEDHIAFRYATNPSSAPAGTAGSKRSGGSCCAPQPVTLVLTIRPAASRTPVVFQPWRDISQSELSHCNRPGPWRPGRALRSAAAAYACSFWVTTRLGFHSAHVFEIEPDLIKKPSDLLRVLLLAITGNSESRLRSMNALYGFSVNRDASTIGPGNDHPGAEAFFAFLQEPLARLSRPVGESGWHERS